MPPRLSARRANTFETKVFDEMSDGQWHRITKITRNCVEKKVSTSAEIKDTVTNLSEQGYLLAGASDSYRLPEKYVRQWRTSRGMSMETTNSHSPRFFGGILEDDGWAHAPLVEYDLLNFRANSHITLQDIQLKIGNLGKVHRMEDALFRIFSQEGHKVYGILKEWDNEDDQVAINGLRITEKAFRRDINKLPYNYLEDFCKFYGKFSYVFLRNSMSSVKKHLPENDDVQQQIYLWIIDAVERYDDSTCIPFAAWLSTCLNRWVHNLNRKSHGRAVADNELKHLRAKAEFESEHGREPNLRELAMALGETIEKVSKESASIKIVANLRSTTTINSEDFDIPLVAEETAESHVDNKLSNTSITAALIASAREKSDETKGGSLVALMQMIDKNWHKDKTLSKYYRNKRPADLQKNEKVLVDSFAKKIEDSHN